MITYRLWNFEFCHQKSTFFTERFVGRKRSIEKITDYYWFLPIFTSIWRENFISLKFDHSLKIDFTKKLFNENFPVYSPLFLKNSEIFFTVQNSYLLLCQLLFLLACFLRHQRELQIRLVYSVGYCVPHGFLGDLLEVSGRLELVCHLFGYCGFPYL